MQQKSSDPMQVKKEPVSKTDGKEAQEEQERRTRQAVAKINEEIEMEQKGRGNEAITMENSEGGTKMDTEEDYSEDPSKIGIVACSSNHAILSCFNVQTVLHLFLKCLVTMPFQ